MLKSEEAGLQPAGPHFKHIVEVTPPAELVREAEAWAKAQKIAALAANDNARRDEADQVLSACGRLNMLQVGGRNRHYDPGPDREIVKSYLHPHVRA